jgi:hypothetical protein
MTINRYLLTLRPLISGTGNEEIRERNYKWGPPRQPHEFL